MPDLKDVRLPLVDGRPCGDALRLFLMRLGRARETLVLPDENPALDWAAVGLDAGNLDKPPSAPDLHTLLLHMNYCLALPRT